MIIRQRFYFDFLFHMGFQDNYCVIHGVLLDIQDQLLVYLFNSNSLGSIHVNPLLGKHLDIA